MGSAAVECELAYPKAASCSTVKEPMRLKPSGSSPLLASAGLGASLLGVRSSPLGPGAKAPAGLSETVVTDSMGLAESGCDSRDPAAGAIRVSGTVIRNALFRKSDSLIKHSVAQQIYIMLHAGSECFFTIGPHCAQIYM